MKSTMYSLIHHLKYNYEANGDVINMLSQRTNGSILKNLCQVKQETHIEKKLKTNLVQHLWLDLDQERLIKCYI
jgi:hypothetical protein